MHRNVRSLLAVALAALVVLALSACGSESGSSSGASNDDLCTNAEELQQSLSEDAFATMDKETFERIEQDVANVKEQAPDEIKADVDTIEAGFADVKEIFSTYDYDLNKITEALAADPELRQRLQAVADEDFSAAGDRLSAYFQDTCGIDAGS